MPEQKDGCVKPAKGPIVANTDTSGQAKENSVKQEVSIMTARVGKSAIDFEANAFLAGEGFKTVRLADYKGQWIVLCFYPGDFTFV